MNTFSFEYFVLLHYYDKTSEKHNFDTKNLKMFIFFDYLNDDIMQTLVRSCVGAGYSGRCL